jgi:hypothetical protein
VYALNQRGLTQLKSPDGSAVAVRLVPGDVFTLPEGKGSIQLEGWTRWVKLQVGGSPGASLVLGAIAFAVAGLCLSLFVRPRRVWVRISTREDGGLLMEVAGLDRADARTGVTEFLTTAMVFSGRDLPYSRLAARCPMARPSGSDARGPRQRARGDDLLRRSRTAGPGAALGLVPHSHNCRRHLGCRIQHRRRRRPPVLT